MGNTAMFPPCCHTYGWPPSRWDYCPRLAWSPPPRRGHRRPQLELERSQLRRLPSRNTTVVDGRLVFCSGRRARRAPLWDTFSADWQGLRPPILPFVGFPGPDEDQLEGPRQRIRVAQPSRRAGDGQ